ncbi:MAG: replication-associated recombination protein A [Clostridia bacterium]|nr:replication-associated recombination protein A [Clostridia bacterium]
MTSPLADRIRPDKLEDFVGQSHLISSGKLLFNLINSGNISNMIFYGPSGTGKTTMANIAAKMSNKRLYKLNATNASVSDIKAIISDIGTLGSENGILLYLDEIQNFNKKQQQSLLEVIENGSVTLIASTTENPYFYVYNAILSRSAVFEFLPLNADDVLKAVRRGANILEDELGIKIEFDDFALEAISQTCGGDVRKALNTLEMCVMSAGESVDAGVRISVEMVEQASSKKAFRHDRDGDSHYDVLSAFQKSIRGSDPDAAVHYLARILSAGDLASACRRLMVIASEDIGLSYPMAASIVKSCVDSALQLGLPEARIPLAQATLLLATAPKSNSVVCAIDSAMSDIEKGNAGDVPLHLKDAHYSGAKEMGRGVEYLYPHSFPNNYVKQEYLPETLRGRKYYIPQNNKNEMAIHKFWEQIKKGDK